MAHNIIGTITANDNNKVGKYNQLWCCAPKPAATNWLGKVTNQAVNTKCSISTPTFSRCNCRFLNKRFISCGTGKISRAGTRCCGTGRIVSTATIDATVNNAVSQNKPEIPATAPNNGAIIRASTKL